MDIIANLLRESAILIRRRVAVLSGTSCHGEFNEQSKQKELKVFDLKRKQKQGEIEKTVSVSVRGKSEARGERERARERGVYMRNTEESGEEVMPPKRQ